MRRSVCTSKRCWILIGHVYHIGVRMFARIAVTIGQQHRGCDRQSGCCAAQIQHWSEIGSLHLVPWHVVERVYFGCNDFDEDL